MPPPICFFAFLMVGLLDSTWINGRSGSTALLIIGGCLTLVSFIFLVMSARKHKTAGSNVEPWKPTTAIITDGVYKYSRNPIYVAMAAAYVGIAIAASSFLAIVLLPFCLYVIRQFVIAKEETYLEDKFGDEYVSYKAKVRRWL
ncbi:MAG: isoprenylcysteine carboxyl methyltransferase [Sneathiella sp.]|nr:MAG: isoprenylcysteine carboxyl methyltransferase [Sneathiella sp.]